MSKKLATRSKIKESYIKLIDIKNPLSISVTDICDECDINRSTFYEYFSSLDELVKEIVRDRIDVISNDVGELYEAYHTDKVTNIESVKKYILDFSQDEVITKLIKSSDSEYFKSLIISESVNREINNYQINDKLQRYKAIYRNSGVFAVIFKWIEEPNELSLDDTSKLLYELIISSNE